jgi:hypothetical protein
MAWLTSVYWIRIRTCTLRNVCIYFQVLTSPSNRATCRCRRLWTSRSNRVGDCEVSRSRRALNQRRQLLLGREARCGPKLQYIDPNYRRRTTNYSIKQVTTRGIDRFMNVQIASHAASTFCPSFRNRSCYLQSTRQGNRLPQHLLQSGNVAVSRAPAYSHLHSGS